MPTSETPSSRLRFIPWVFLLLGLVLTYALQNVSREAERHALQDEFDFRVNEIVANINKRLGSYEQILQGTAGLFAASQSVERNEFVAYVESLKLGDKYPGIQGVGFSKLVLPQDKSRHIAAVRAEGLADYDIRPAGQREIYTSIIYLEPSNWRNQRAIGYDMYSEPARREAMEKSRDEDQTRISGKVRLVQETEKDVQPGFLMYLPVYRPQTTHQSISERRANLMGWVYAPFRMNDLMAGILEQRFGEVSAALDCEIYDGDAPDASKLMFDSNSSGDRSKPKFESIRQFALLGHQWTVGIYSLAPFDARLNSDKANIIALAGVVASLLLALVAQLLVTGRSRALAIAEGMTGELKKREIRLSTLNRNLRLRSDCNMALVQADDEIKLLTEVCRLCVESGGYLMAWVGYAEQDAAKTVKPVAQSGFEDGYLDHINITWADTEHGRGPTGMAIRSGMPEINQDVLHNPKFAPWREAAIQRGYQSSVALPIIFNTKVLGALMMYAREANAFDPEEVQLLCELANDLGFGIEMLRTRAENNRIAYQHQHHEEILRKSLEQSIKAIANTVEARDPYTAGHQQRVSLLAEAIAREMGMEEHRIHGLVLAASIHDLGKVQIPAEILSKPTKLTEIEFMLIKTHPKSGYEILKGIEFPWPIADIVHQHHEKLDGSGYPQGLKADQILLESRILTVADIVEAMASHRPYRAALGIDVALKEIERGRGSIYDSTVADACLKIFRENKFAFQN